MVIEIRNNLNQIIYLVGLIDSKWGVFYTLEFLEDASVYCKNFEHTENLNHKNIVDVNVLLQRISASTASSISKKNTSVFYVSMSYHSKLSYITCLMTIFL